mgnify:CR=1 FL=1
MRNQGDVRTELERDYWFPDYPIFNPLKLAIELGFKVMRITYSPFIKHYTLAIANQNQGS